MDVLKGLTHRKLYRLADDKKILGVCAGLADSFQVDPTLMRLGWVLVTILTAGPGGILIYLVMAFIMPVGRPETAQEST